MTFTLGFHSGADDDIRDGGAALAPLLRRHPHAALKQVGVQQTVELTENPFKPNQT